MKAGLVSILFQVASAVVFVYKQLIGLSVKDRLQKE
jgi:hypothetical protein